MKRISIACVVLGGLLVAITSGCASPGDASKIPQMFYSQQRSFTFFEVNNLNEFVLKGSNMTIKMAAPLDPLSMIPKDPNVAMQVFSVAKDIALGGMGIYYAADVMNTLAARPQVISQQVVQPQVYSVRDAGMTESVPEVLP